MSLYHIYWLRHSERSGPLFPAESPVDNISAAEAKRHFQDLNIQIGHVLLGDAAPVAPPIERLQEDANWWGEQMRAARKSEGSKGE